MKTLLVYLKHYRKEAILGPLFKLLEASFELLIPLVVADIIDVGIAGADESIIIRDALLMAALTRSRDSETVLLAMPTMLKPGNP